MAGTSNPEHEGSTPSSITKDEIYAKVSFLAGYTIGAIYFHSGNSDPIPWADKLKEEWLALAWKIKDSEMKL